MVVRELHPAPLPVELSGADGRPPEASAAEARAPLAASASATGGRLRQLVDRHYDFVWRTVRHFGVPDANAEDAAQQVLCVLARRLPEIAPGAEMSFLFSTAVRVASEARRAARRRPEAAQHDLESLVAAAPTPEELVDERRARDVLRKVLGALPDDLREVFVLFEIEELTVAQVAAIVGVPIGTASSRLRRAREEFQAIVRRMHAAQNHRARGDPK